MEEGRMKLELIASPISVMNSRRFIDFVLKERSTRRFLNHAGGDLADHYIRDSALGQLQLAEQETISAHIIKALGSPRGLV
jgi:hypothetical protein